MLFEELNLQRPILNAIEDLGYIYPTPIQENSFSKIMSGRDIVGIAQTGTGKTMAYLLPILRQWKFSNQKHPRSLIIVPTRELVVQVLTELENLTKYMNVKIAGVYGGTNINTQASMVFQGVDILVATPGRLIDLVLKGVLSLKSVKKLVIDEFDEMLNLGFRPQVENILELIPEKRQNILFSATLTSEVEKLFTEYFNNPEKIEVAIHGTPLEKISQVAYHVPNFYTKINLLENLLNNNEELNKVLIFAGSKKDSDLLFENIEPKFPNKIGVIHSNKSQNQRFNALDKFEKGEYRLLIATDIMARGLDISDVSHVINFQMPDVPVDYMHRIGRTGRADKDGVAISFITEQEQEYQMQVEALMNKPITIEQLPAELGISEKLTKDEQPTLSTKNYLKRAPIKQTKGAFHEKKEKNKKTNLGGPRFTKSKSNKPSNRSAAKRKARKK